MAPYYHELAKILASHKNIIVAKVDSTKNEVKGVPISSYPTIKLWTKGKKESPIDFDGDRTIRGFLSFLKEHVPELDVEIPEDKKEDVSKEEEE